MAALDIHILGSLKALVDAGTGPDLVLDREIDRKIREKPFLLPWTSTIEAALRLFTEFGVEPGELLREVCRHHEEIEGEHFIGRLPRRIISIGLGLLIEREGT